MDNKRRHQERDSTKPGNSCRLPPAPASLLLRFGTLEERLIKLDAVSDV